MQELRLNNITTIEEEKKYLVDVFVPEFNKEFVLDLMYCWFCLV